MKYAAICLSLLFVINEISAQQITKSRERLRKEISEYIVIDSRGSGPGSMGTSLIWRKADTLFGEMPLSKAVSYFYDSSHTLKYYSFLKILLLNDNIAFKLLTSIINDSTLVFCRFDDYRAYQKFNQLLSTEYKIFIQLKYHNGGKIRESDCHYFGTCTYYFPKPNEKLWNMKYSKLSKLAALSGLKPV